MPFNSNIPTVLAQQDFNDKHADMLAAAREGVTNLVYDSMFDEMVTKEEFKRRRHERETWNVGKVLRIRLPDDFIISNGDTLMDLIK